MKANFQSGLKICSTCRLEKSIINGFCKDKSRSDGLCNRCFECMQKSRNKPEAKRKRKESDKRRPIKPGTKERIRAYAARPEVKERRSQTAREKYGEPKSIAGMLFRGARWRAQKKSIPFNLTLEYVLSILPSHCPALGIKLERSAGKAGKGGPRDNSYTLDRINAKLGYIQGNVVVISGLANRIKSTANLAQLLKIVKWLEQIEILNNP